MYTLPCFIGLQKQNIKKQFSNVKGRPILLFHEQQCSSELTLAKIDTKGKILERKPKEDNIVLSCSDTEAVAFGGLGASVDVKLLSQVLVQKSSINIICEHLGQEFVLFVWRIQILQWRLC